MTDDLVKRLRSMHWCVTTETNGVGVSDRKVALDAADRIEALTAERDCYRKAQAENDNAWAALWYILACETPNANATVTRMAAIARAALKGESHE